MQIAEKKDLDVYSTSEQVVGTWIDGKPIYRKVIETTTPSTGNSSFPSNSAYSDISIGASVDNVILLDGYLIGQTVSYSLSKPLSNSEWFLAWVRTDRHASKPNTIGLSCGMASTNRNIAITIEYTKTTD